MLVANHRHDSEAADEGGCLQAASESELSIVAASHPAHWQVDGSDLLIRPRHGSFLGPTDMAAIEHGSCEQTQETATFICSFRVMSVMRNKHRATPP